uniref:BHLH domain-containing protein n=1 Tax=Ciona savignyi TaxID=51511 RepID=H2YF02_CIOSA
MPVERRMTDAEIRRKTNKPIMEKKRRERINKCLEDLKTIVLTAVSEESRPNKLEKADILEMTVRYLKSLQQGKPIDAGILSTSCTSDYDDSDDDTKSSLTLSSSYSAEATSKRGYTQCVQEVNSFLSRNDGIPLRFRTQLLGHLADRCNPVEGYDRKNVTAPTHQHNLMHKRYASEFGRSITTPSKPNDTFPHPYQITQHKQCAVNRCSPIPISPISRPSNSPFTFRRLPSPALSDESDTASYTTAPHTSDLCFSPAQVDMAKRSHMHYMSSDSGIWSSGSSPPSPVDNLKSIDQSQPKPTAMWRPWGL